MYGWKRMIDKLKKCLGNKKVLTLLMALTMILASASGGTLAWLESRTPAVVNTFTYGMIDISLAETDTGKDGDNNPDTNLYEMGLGQAIAKDPHVTVEAGSADCWLFVRVDESANFADFMEYDMADGWQALAEGDGVYYRMVDSAQLPQDFPVLKDDVVNMKATATLQQLAALTSADYPTLTITAYAVQRDSSISEISTPANAWQIMQVQLQPPVR